MAVSIVPQNCPICKEDIRPGQRRVVIGIDQSTRGAAPANVYAHWDCVTARGFTGCFLLRPGEEMGRLFDGPAQARLALEVG
jgi:hypothetical protein